MATVALRRSAPALGPQAGVTFALIRRTLREARTRTLGFAYLFAAWSMASQRDVGTGVLSSRDTSPPREALLSSPTAHAWRGERVGVLIWTAGVGAMALVIGVLSTSVSSLGISKPLQQTLRKLGAGSALTPKAYIGFSFSFFVLLVCLFAVSQLAMARQEEASERLEALLALPVSRLQWLGGRLALAAAGCAWIALCAGLLGWLGAISQGVTLALPTMLEACANCLPAAVLFLGIAALAYAAVPRAGGGLAYGLLVLAYLWQLFGALLGAPKWLEQATPFAHVAAVPAVAFRAVPAGIMTAAGLLTSLAALALFRHRDLRDA